VRVFDGQGSRPPGTVVIDGDRIGTGPAGADRRRGGPGCVRDARGTAGAARLGARTALRGSNFFWYLKDPAGNFSEYYSDMDCIVDDQLWTPEDLEGARGLFAWGPPPPPSFLHPEDLAVLMTCAHASR
jgi:hypothetical protein